jgi:hypothetical protein
MKGKLLKWWMCDFCGGMADPINYNMFRSVSIGIVIGIVLGVML